MAHETQRRVLDPAAGVSREIGFYLAGMDEVREQLRDAVAQIPSQDVGRLAVAEAHSIGALVLHIGEAEWWWMQCVLQGHTVTEEEAAAVYWDVLTEPRRVADHGYSAQFCLDEISKIRAQTREVLASLPDDSLDRVFTFERNEKPYDLNLRWILHHLIDHEAQHKGQILMLKRLLGLKNDGLFA